MKAMYDTQSARIACPYCGEPIEVLVDPSVDYQEYIEDCSVCCRPISLVVTVSGDDVSVTARDENDV
jgi:hypothetical protein